MKYFLGYIFKKIIDEGLFLMRKKYINDKGFRSDQDKLLYLKKKKKNSIEFKYK